MVLPRSPCVEVHVCVPPQSADGHARVAWRALSRGADVWAFGCTLYETMRLQEPWSHLVLPETGNLQGGLMGLLRHIRTSTLDLSPLRSRYSERLVGFVGSLLEKKRKRRLEKLSEHLERLVVPERPKPVCAADALSETPSPRAHLRAAHLNPVMVQSFDLAPLCAAACLVGTLRRSRGRPQRDERSG